MRNRKSFEIESLIDKKVLFVVSSGGHLQEAMLIQKKFGLSRNSIFLTHENQQTKSLLSDYEHYFLSKVGTRQWVKAILVSKEIILTGCNLEFDLIISTGAAIAVATLPLHIFFRKPFLYIESLTRTQSPSLTGRILEKIPSVICLSSNFGARRTGWNEIQSPLSELSLVKRWKGKKKFNVFVTLGTHSQFKFDRLIEIVLGAIREDDSVTWQIDYDPEKKLPGKVVRQFSDQEFIDVARNSDVVITHCGIGNLLRLINLGIKPLAIPRESSFNEHIDNHQLDAYKLFYESNLIGNSIDKITREDLEYASFFRLIE